VSEQQLSAEGVAELYGLFATRPDVRRVWLYRLEARTPDGEPVRFPHQLWAELDKPPASNAEEGELMRDLTALVHAALLAIYRREEFRMDGVIPLKGHMLDRVAEDGRLLYERLDG
jgi:hypothetical protein